MWIHEHKDWPNFTWDEESIERKSAVVRNAIQKWKDHNRILKELKVIAGFKDEDDFNLVFETADKTSELENEKLNKDSLKNSIMKRLFPSDSKKEKHTENTDGLVDMVLDANWNYELKLDSNRIWKWHKWLFPDGYSGLNKIRTGSWRNSVTPMRVITEGRDSFDGKGDIVHYEAPEVDRLEKEMEAFIYWFENEDLDPVIKAGVAHIWFEFIHPLQDGNGRIGRAIMDLMLARAGEDDQPFHNMTGQISIEGNNYHNLLDSHSKISNDKPLDITEWLEWFLECLTRSMKNAKEILAITENKLKVLLYIQHNHRLNGRQKQVVSRMLEREWKGLMTLSKYETIGKCNNSRTAARDISELKKYGLFIKSSGNGPKTSYRLIEWSDIEEKEVNRKKSRNESIGSGNSKAYA